MNTKKSLAAGVVALTHDRDAEGCDGWGTPGHH